MNVRGGYRPIIRGHDDGDVVLPIIRSSELTIVHPPIGNGAFGRVYKGKCRGMDVAVKVLDGITWDDNVRKDFVDEVGVMVRLLHPNIVLCMGACIDQDEKGQTHYAIILEFMQKGDLQTLIHDPKVQMSLPRQLQCGIDICKGMAWLSAQSILHRDLKPANVLVDQNWTCKICDFGLSQIQKTKQKMQDEDEAAGSVLWMAPEVLLKEKIDSKLDVYSFALVLWEILTRADLFSEYEDKDVFTEAIAIQGIRPPLEGIHHVLQAIISRAWDRDPNNRPNFEELLVLLQKALIEIYLPKNLWPTESVFWETYFRGKSKAPWDYFLKRFVAALGKRISKYLIEIACLEKLAVEEEGGEKYITIERFSNLLKWFGKMTLQTNDPDILTRIHSVMKNEWFFGGISSSEAEKLLDQYKNTPGTFIVRLNMGGSNPIEKSPYTISRIDSRGKILHTRIQHLNKDSGFKIKVNTGSSKLKLTHSSNRPEEFISQIREQQQTLFKMVCPGWPYQALFSQNTEKSVYEEEESDSSDKENEIKV